ncbi:hypothetical protein Pmani_034185 [Petrolisthes manimaculis]|uniref:Nuclear receptor coactivator 4 n=1 Tax=Petrolisthes manimaculis TaxID=1843537 RepID=A0AAE1TPN8_9EUCA|nr:hypothetical protein Pmani_034185 [Petrolisthes manimaculis]
MKEEVYCCCHHLHLLYFNTIEMSLVELEQEVAEKLAKAESYISEVEEVHHNLQEYARKVELRIHETADRQVEALRVRERQLVRQVEVVTYLEGVGLRSRQANLMQKKGALSATKDLLQRCSKADTATLAKIKVEDMDCQGDVQGMGEVTVQFDEAPLTSAISKFGSVQLPERITHHTSPVIPTSVEEYEDEDHDVLHKSVAGAVAAPGAPLHITVQFPRLANHAWLAKNANAASEKSGSSKGIVLPGAVSKSGDVATWLNGLQLGAGQDDEAEFSAPVSAASFDMLTDNTPSQSSNSSSIEIVPSHYGSDKDGCSTPASGMCEIENLHLYVGDKSRWLSSKTTQAAYSPMQQLQVKNVCQANEACQSFNDCVCKNKCKEAAMEKLQQSADFRARASRKRTLSQAEGARPILDHMAKILASDNNGWLPDQSLRQSSVPIPLKRAMYKAPVERWLNLGGCTNTISSPRVQLSAHSNIWLLKHMKNQNMKVAEEKEEKEKENEKDEKESMITTDDLTEALKKASIDHTSKLDKSWVLDSSTNSISDKSSSTLSNFKVGFLMDNEKPWLLSKDYANSRLMARDNKLEEKDAFNKRQWLSCSSKSPIRKMMESNEENTLKSKSKLALSSPQLPESVLSVAQAGISNWLMKNFS